MTAIQKSVVIYVAAANTIERSEKNQRNGILKFGFNDITPSWVYIFPLNVHCWSNAAEKELLPNYWTSTENNGMQKSFQRHICSEQTDLWRVSLNQRIVDSRKQRGFKQTNEEYDEKQAQRLSGKIVQCVRMKWQRR